MGKLARILSSTCVFAALAAPALTQPPAQPPSVVSPDVAANRDVTLRVRAPSAERVELVSGGDIPGVPMQGGLPLAKGADGVFTVMLPTLAAGAYRYRFTIDGVPTGDPSNPATSESNGNAWSLFYVPGAPFMDTLRVAHGSVAEVHYFSTALNRARRMHVYTPPGYEKSRDTYPVFYLLHGAFDGDDSWSTVGRAGFIVDNLIASGEARPMIVVMPDGHTSRFGGGGAAGLNMADFVGEWLESEEQVAEREVRDFGSQSGERDAGVVHGVVLGPVVSFSVR